MDIQKIKADKLIPAIYNPRKNLKKGDAEYKKIERSILEFGYVDPIIVNKDMTIIGGHQRYKVLVDLGYDELDCVVVDLPKDREKALNIALNKVSGEWDEALLIDLLGDLGDLAELTGFDAEEIDKLLDNKADVQEDDFDADAALAEIVEPITKRGDIWQLGRHRLMCGDSTDKATVEKLMNGVKADMVFTDPPYNVAYGDSSNPRYTAHVSGKHRLIENDRQTTDQWVEFNKALATIFTIVCKGDIYVWGAPSPDGMRQRLTFIDSGIHWSATIIWKKDRLVLAAGKYQRMYEPCFYGWVKKSSFVADRKQVEVWEVKRPTSSELHPTMKPIELCGRGIENSSKSGHIVLDLFGGSGSTLIACEQLNRICYMMELDEKYCDVIIKRYEELTGQKAELIS